MGEIKYEYTKTPLSYQITEYDCGQTTFLNALRYLFKRSEIEPRIMKMVMQNTLDKSNSKGEIGKGGTSIYAIEFLSQWLNDISNVSDMKIETKIIKGEDVNTYNEDLLQCLDKGGVAIFSVWQSEKHYVLCTKIDEKYVYMFDPYYLNINYYDNEEECEIIKDRPFEFNRKVLRTRLDEFSTRDFSFVNDYDRAILLINRK
ncbi:MAG: hypothetical protein HFJ17_03650 [Clostridia bacterium]|nr:hypothetical protein [Clostridia bacterium]